MNIIALCGSPRGEESQTLKIVKAVAKGAQDAGARAELVDLCRLKIEYCRGCEVCHRTGKCVHKDDFAALRERLAAADGLVFATPTYFRMVTAQMKTAIDRMSDVIHCQLFSGKYACSAAVSGGPGHEAVTQYLSEVVVSLGASHVGAVGIGMSQGPQAFAEAETRAQALGRDLVEAIRTGRVYPEQAKQHKQFAAYFKRLCEMSKDRWPHEYAFWTDGAARGKKAGKVTG